MRIWSARNRWPAIRRRSWLRVTHWVASLVGTASASAAYVKPLGNALELATRLFYTYQSGRNSVVALNSPAYFEIRGGGLTSLALSLGKTARWETALHIDNLFNDFVPLSAKSLDGNQVRSVTAARPRTVALTFNMMFH